MLYGIPYAGFEPKSGCRPMFKPIEAMSVAEFLATGRAEMSLFQTLVDGKMGQFGAPGSGVKCLPDSAAGCATVKNRSGVMPSAQPVTHATAKVEIRFIAVSLTGRIGQHNTYHPQRRLARLLFRPRSLS